MWLLSCVQEIHKQISLLNFHDCHAKIRQVDSQATVGDGVVIQVSAVSSLPSYQCCSCAGVRGYLLGNVAGEFYGSHGSREGIYTKLANHLANSTT